MKGMAKIRLFYSGAMALILPQWKNITHFVFLCLYIREGLKKNKKKIMENSILGGGGGVSRGHFPYPFFFIFFAPNGLKIIFRHWSFFMYRGGPPLGLLKPPPPRLHRYILRWQNHVKAKIACVVDKTLHVAAVIAHVTSKFGIWGEKNLLV